MNDTPAPTDKEPFLITTEVSQEVMSLIMNRTKGPREAHAVLVAAFIMLNDLNTQMTLQEISLDKLAEDVANSIRTAKIMYAKPN